MGILAEDIARVREATDFVQLAGEHIALKKVGQRYIGLCPFHAEKTPSFSINANEGLYYCFGCQAKGDVITFVREVEHLEFAEAVERLAAKAGVQVRYDQVAVSRDRQRRDRLVDVVRQFQLGWAPDDWDALGRALKVSDDLLRDTGLGFVNRRNRQQDAFRA